MTGAEAIRLSNSSGSSSWRADWGVGRGSVKEQALIHQVEGDPRRRERPSTSLQGQQPGKGELGSAGLQDLSSSALPLLFHSCKCSFEA